MAMNAGGMASDVIAALQAAGLPYNPEHKWWEAVCQGIINHIASNMDILPVSHGATPLSNDIGQPSSGLDPQGGTVNSVTNAPQPIIGTGSAQ